MQVVERDEARIAYEAVGARYLELVGVGHAVPAYLPEAVDGPLVEHLVAAEPSFRVEAS